MKALTDGEREILAEQEADAQPTQGTCDGWPQMGCPNDARNHMLKLCDECARNFTAPDAPAAEPSALEKLQASYEDLAERYDAALDTITELRAELERVRHDLRLALMRAL